MEIVALILSIPACLLLIASTIAFLKAKDVFMMSHIVMAANFYIIPLLLLGIEFERFSWISFAKITALIILNLVVSSLLCHATLRRAMINKIMPDAEIKN